MNKYIDYNLFLNNYDLLISEISRLYKVNARFFNKHFVHFFVYLLIQTFQLRFYLCNSIILHFVRNLWSQHNIIFYYFLLYFY